VSLGLAVPLFVVGALLWGVVPGAALLTGLAILLLPAGIAVAVLKYRLYEIDLVINRALVYGVMTIVTLAAYVAIVGLIGATLSSRSDLFLSLVVTGVVAVCFQPVRERVQRFVNRLMYGDRDDPYTAIATLGRTLAASLQLDTVVPTIVETIGQTLAVPYVAIALADGALREAAIAAEYGIPSADFLTFPLVHQGIALGELRLAARPGERLRERDHHLIADLAPQVAAAVHAVGLSQNYSWRDSASSSFAKRSADASAATSTTASDLPWPGLRSHSRPSVTSPARISSAPTNCSSQPPNRYRR
jgi:two-component system NarL family sensor kinase